MTTCSRYEIWVDLLTIVDGILDFSKIESKERKLEIVEFSLSDCLDDTIGSLVFPAHKKGLELVCQVLPDVPGILLGDPAALRQVVCNLVSNSIKFTNSGEVVLRARKERETEDELYIHFQVEDTGIGITPEQQKLFFNPFTQADGSATRKHEGIGLGLTISSQLIQMMGGRIWVETEEGHGSTFHFTARFNVPKAAGAVQLKAGILQGIAALVVDDNATNRRILQEMLADWGCRVTSVIDGGSALIALQQARESGRTFAVILADSQMPGLDGFALAAAIQGGTELAAMIMMLTSSGDSGEAARCRELGIAGYLFKPVRQSELIELFFAFYD